MSKNKIYTIISLAVIIPAAILISGQILKNKNGPESDSPTYQVKRGPLTISFVESGTIKARDQIILKNEVEGKTSITYVISEGTRVKKGDLLIELDVSTLEDQKIDREISVQNTEAAYISAKKIWQLSKTRQKAMLTWQNLPSISPNRTLRNIYRVNIRMNSTRQMPILHLPRKN